MSGVIPIGISTLPRRCHQTMGSDTQPLIVGSSFRGGGGGNGQPLSVSGSGGASAYHGGALVGGSVIEARSYGSSTHRVDQTPGILLNISVHNKIFFFTAEGNTPLN